MDEDTRIWQRKSLSVSARRQQQGSHRCALTDADSGHIGSNELHRVVDRHAGGYGSAGAVDVERNVAIRVFSLKKQELRDHQIGNRVVDRGTDKDDVVFEEPRVNVKSTFAARGLLNNH